MTVDSLNTAYEVTLRTRMKAYAADLDVAVKPAPPLRALLADRRSTPRDAGRISLRLGLSIGAGIVAIALFLGLPAFGGRQNSGPLASVTPSAVVSPSEPPAAASSPIVVSPSLSPSVPSSPSTSVVPSPSPSPAIAKTAGPFS